MIEFPLIALQAMQIFLKQISSMEKEKKKSDNFVTSFQIDYK